MPVLMPGPEAQTVCHLLVILFLCLTSVTGIQHILIKREVSDGVIAPGYTEEALEILKAEEKRQL